MAAGLQGVAPVAGKFKECLPWQLIAVCPLREWLCRLLRGTSGIGDALHDGADGAGKLAFEGDVLVRAH